VEKHYKFKQQQNMSQVNYNIKDLANIISKVVKYNGKIIFNTNFPDGVKERKLDSTQFINLGWKPKIKLKNGLVNYYKNFVKKYY
jgi:GDP-L-fucose synthase